MISENKIHYAKSSIRKWEGEKTRVKINSDIVGTKDNSIHKLQWKMTQELRELPNGLDEDIDWKGYEQMRELWKEFRKEHGHKVKLWIGKLHHRATKFTPGKAQATDRVPYAVCLLVLHRTTGTLQQIVHWEEWHNSYEFHSIEGAEYNRVWDWRNPRTSTVGSRTRKVEL